MGRSSLLIPLSIATFLAGLTGYILQPSQQALLAAAFILTMAVAGMTGWSIAGRPNPEPFDVRIMDATLLVLAFLAASVLLLGSFGILDWWLLVAATGVVGFVWGLTGHRGASSAGTARTGRLRLDALTVLAVALGMFGVVQAVLGRVFRPPVGDPLAYHLPFAVEWLQRSSLVMPAPAAGDPSPPFYPLNSSTWTYWLLAPFESEVLARFVQLPFLGLLALGTYRLGRKLNLSTAAAAMSATLAISVPSIARSASLPENDLILTALLVISTAYLVMLVRRFTVWRAGICALAIGLAIGTKVIALALGGILGAIWIVLVMRGLKPAGVGPVARLLATGALIVVALGGYSYIRNAVVMDNPLYPAGYELPGGFVLDGLYFPTWEWRQDHVFFAFDWDAFLFRSRRDFGWTVTFWAIPGTLLAVLVAIPGWRSGWRGASGIIPVLWVGLSLLIFWYVIPYHFSRFLFATVVMAIVAGMWAVGKLAEHSRSGLVMNWYPALAVPIIIGNLINIPLDPSIRERLIYWIAAVVVIAGTGAGLLLVRRLTADRFRPLLATSVAVVALIAVIAWPFYVREYEERRMNEWRALVQGFSQAPDAWAWIEAETAGTEAVISVAGTNEIYPLYGPDLENRVVTIWHSGERAEYDWGEPFTLYSEPRRAAWEDQIHRTGVDYIVITENVSFGGWPVEREWLMASPDLYRLVFRNMDIEVWEVIGIPKEAARYTVR